MGYGTVAAITARLSADTLNDIADRDGDGAYESAVIQAAIDAAAAEIDEVIGVVTATPLTAPYPPNVVVLNEDMAIVRLFRDAQNLPDIWKDVAERFDQRLENIVKGLAILAGTSGDESTPPGADAEAGADDARFDDTEW